MFLLVRSSTIYPAHGTRGPSHDCMDYSSVNEMETWVNGREGADRDVNVEYS